MNSETFDWKRFHAYRVFDEFLDQFILRRKSYVTCHDERLDLTAAFEDIRDRFVADFDDSDAKYEEKVTHQFEGASEETKIVFANVEYLWAMPMKNITPSTKRSYALRWFREEDQVVAGESFFFGHPHIIANPGPWYLRNKYWEIISALRILSIVAADRKVIDVASAKARIAELCYSAIYDGVPEDDKFAVSNFCGIHAALMHLADPDQYESIISASHRTQICAVFGHIVDPEISSDCPEKLLKQIRDTLYESHGNSDNPDRKFRWFFYTKDVRPLWIDKKTKKAQRESSAVFDVRTEEDALDLEGTKEEVTGYRIRRSAKLVKQTKVRDSYCCRACGFHFENQIVHVHHLDPLSEYKRPLETKLKDLVTLCPTCHYLAHYWLKMNSKRFKQLDPLLEVLRKTKHKST